MPGPASQFALTAGGGGAAKGALGGKALAATSVAKAQFLKEAGMGLGLGLGLGLWTTVGLGLAAGGFYLAFKKTLAE